MARTKKKAHNVRNNAPPEQNANIVDGRRGQRALPRQNADLLDDQGGAENQNNN